MNTFILLFLEKICEAIYFSLFLLIGKNIKEKRVLFTFFMIFEYLALKSFIHYNIWFQIIYTFISFVNLKVFYKDKAQITDIFLFMAASIILIISSLICGFTQIILGINHYFLLFINRILIFLIIYLLKNKLYYFYRRYFKCWNRHNHKNKIKSLTLRNISVIIFNIMFYVLNICMLYMIYLNK